MGSKEQAGGIESAANTQAAASAASIASQEKMFDRSIELQEPFRQAGMEALPSLSALSRGDITKTPQFLLQQQEGTEAIDKAAAARGGFGSTSTVRSIGEFNRRLLGSESDKQYGRLLDLVNIGRGAATNQGSAAMATGAGISQTQSQAGTNLANLQFSGAQNRASTYANLGSIPSQTISSLANAGVFNQQPAPGSYTGGQTMVF
jgi:hypothetical protein